MLVLAGLLLSAPGGAAGTKVPDVGEAIFRIVLESKTAAQMGTAFIMPGRGSTVLTAQHAVEPGGPVLREGVQERYLTNGTQRVPFVVVKEDAKQDIAIVRPAEATELLVVNPLRWADDNPPLLGPVIVVGFPSAGFGHQFLAFTPGQVVSTNLDAWPNEGGKFYTISSPGVIQGQSGSPVFNEYGQVAGMLVKGYHKGGVVHLVVPVGKLRRFE